MKHNYKAILACTLFLLLGLYLWQPLSLAGQGAIGSSAALYPIHAGFPVLVPGHVTRSSPTIVDLNKDGSNELLVGTYNGDVYGWDANGTILPGFPLTNNGHIISSLAFGDLNGNGDLEIVAGIGSVNTGVDGKVYVWRPNGTLLPGWPQKVDRFGNIHPSKVSSVALADVDGDNALEIVASTNNNVVGTGADPTMDVPDLYVWEQNGNLSSGNWPALDEPSIEGAVAVGDLTGDGQINIVTGRDYNRLFAYDNQGNDLPGWPLPTFVDVDGAKNNFDPRIVNKRTSPVLADLDGDGEVEYISTGFRKEPNNKQEVNSDTLVLQPDGSRRPGWETTASANGIIGLDIDKMHQVAAVADLNGDGSLDIVIPYQDGWIRAYSADKTLLWVFDYAKGQVIHASDPIIGDVDNDGQVEVIFGSHDPTVGTVGPTGLWILEHDGTVKAGSPLSVSHPGIMAPPSLGDLDNDGLLEIVASTRRGKIYVWDTASPNDPVRLPWPMARYDLQRTAFVNNQPQLNQPQLTAEKSAAPTASAQGKTVTYTIRLSRSTLPFTTSIQLTDTIPSGLAYIPDSLTATSGSVDQALAPQLRWSGNLSDTTMVEISYQVNVTAMTPLAIVNEATISSAGLETITRTATIIVNGEKVYLPLIQKN